MPLNESGHRASLFIQYLPAFFPSLTVLAGNFLGGIWTISNMVFTLVLLVLVDFLLPDDAHKNRFTHAGGGDAILLLAVVIHVGCVFSLLAGVYDGRISGPWVWTAAVSTGLNAGLLGLNTAHELIHRKSSLSKALGVVNLFFCCYGHFFIEHRFGHHARVATIEDPATARKGEGFYRFLLRTIPGQWISGYRLAARSSRNSSGNFVLWITMAELMLVIALYLIVPEIAFAFLVSCVAAIFLLEYVNYIEHYGLIRNEGERLAAHHAWQSDSVTSRFHLFELSRHSHHHLQAMVPFPELESMESPHRLPFGYFGMFYIALVPMLWFRVMDKRIEQRF